MSGVRRRVAAVGVSVSLAMVGLAGGVASATSGDLDAGFGGTGRGRVVVNDVGSLYGVAVQAAGGIIEVGGGPGQATVVRLRPDGTRDTSFGTRVLTAPGGPAEAYAVTIQGDGKILVAGAADTGPTRDMGVWRLLPTGALDGSFGTDGFASFGYSFSSDDAYAVAVDAQGRPVVAGYTGKNDDMLVVRFTSGGLPDVSFNIVGGVGVPYFQINSVGGAAAEAVAIQPADGRIVVTGDDGFAAGLPVYRIVPGDASTIGSAVLDDSFDGDGLAVVRGIGNSGRGLSLQPEGAILAVGSTSSIGGGEPAVVRLTPAGAVDAGYGSETGVHLRIPDATGGTATAVAEMPTGGVAVSGITQVAGTLRPFVARLDASGVVDTAMGPGGARLLGQDDTRIDAVAVQPDGKVVTAGTTSGTGGAANAGVVYRLLGDFSPPETRTCAGKAATIVGITAADTLVGTDKPDVIAGLGGDDTITGLGKGDIVCGGAGNDHITGAPGVDQLYGQAGRDTLSGGKGRDQLIGGRGPDLLKGGARRDTLSGGKGRDQLIGGRGRDVLKGGARRDTLSGGKGRDQLIGGRGRDVLKGGPGPDILVQ